VAHLRDSLIVAKWVYRREAILSKRNPATPTR